MGERKAGQPYSREEILSLDRIKRAMTTRILDRIEDLWQHREVEVIGCHHKILILFP